ncbi:MAG: VanZ family protein [Erysipelotrichaceae bacterium]|nr:VanZ family protein [Erysipelotrichaceae bacterium]
MKKYLKPALLMAWMSVIFFMSGQSGAESSNTSNMVIFLMMGVLKVFFPEGLPFDEAAFIATFAQPVRKLAHFSEYLILGILMVMNIKDLKRDKAVIISTVLCALYAMTDEVHQLFVPNRYCSLMDMLLDTAGSITGIVLYHLFAKDEKHNDITHTS